MGNSTWQQILSWMQEYCSRSEKCKFDVKRKMTEADVSEDIQIKVIASLTKESFIDENRYAKAFVLDKFRFNSWGRIRIRVELQQREIQEDLISEALQEISIEDYHQTIRALIKVKYIKAKTDYEYQQKLLRYMYGKGFEPDVVRKILGEIED